MKGTKWLAGLSLAVGLLSAGCGGVVPESAQAEPQLETREDEQPDCSNPGALFTVYFSDATYTTEIGGRGCSCYSYMSYGSTSVYKQYHTNEECW